MKTSEIEKYIEETVEPIITKATGQRDGVNQLLEQIARGVWEIAYQLSRKL